MHLCTKDRSFAFSSYFTREALCERGARCSEMGTPILIEMVAHVHFPIYKSMLRLRCEISLPTFDFVPPSDFYKSLICDKPPDRIDEHGAQRLNLLSSLFYVDVQPSP